MSTKVQLKLEQLLSNKLMKYILEKGDSLGMIEKEQIIPVADFAQFTGLNNEDAFNLLQKTIVEWFNQTIDHQEAKPDNDDVDQRIISTYNSNYNNLTEQGKITISFSTELQFQLTKRLNIL